MNQATHNSLVAFIWRIADDCLRDVYVRGKYRDVILPMVVLYRGTEMRQRAALVMPPFWSPWRLRFQGLSVRP